MRVAFCTLGCKVNQYETDKMKQQFINNNANIVDFTDKADVYIVNSCSVTNLATRKTRNFLSRAKKQGGIVVLCGCYSQELQTKKEADKISNVDIIIGNEEKNDVYEIVSKFLKDNKKVFKVSDISEVKSYKESKVLNKAFDIRESVKIEDGCNNFCSYCIIPYVRGRVRSRNLNDILEEIKHLTKTGVKEVVLVGIEIASYGKDLNNDITLVDVVEEVSKIDNIERIRLGSIEPRILTDENIERLSKIKKLCPHFHISVQNLSDNVLKNMNRKYTSEFVISRAKKLKECFEDTALTCDIIVGFPGETDEDFKTTLSNLDKISFYEIHTFKYSKRKWTKAAKMEGQVDGVVANDRSEKLIKYASKKKFEYMEKYLNKKMRVLFESYEDGILTGYTTNYIKVKIRGDKDLCQKVLEVELCSIKDDYMLGTI